jgi:hypothetical protein
MCRIYQVAGHLGIQARKADVETGAEKVTGITGVEIYLCINRQISRQLYFALGRSNTYCTNKTG